MSKNWHICSTKSDGSIWKKKFFLIKKKKRKRQLTAKLQAFGVPPIPDNCGMMDWLGLRGAQQCTYSYKYVCDPNFRNGRLICLHFFLLEKITEKEVNRRETNQPNAYIYWDGKQCRKKNPLTRITNFQFNWISSNPAV